MISNWLRSRSLILLYHRVARLTCDPWSLAVTPSHFAEHLEVLRKYRRIRLDQLQPGAWLKRRGLSVAITFDDGYADNLLEAARLLRRYETPATFFIATGYIGQQREFWWDELSRIVYESDRPAGATRDEIHERYYRMLQPMDHTERRAFLDRLAREFGVDLTMRETHRPLDTAELQKLAAHAELFEIGAHTVTHPLLAAQTPDVQEAEVRGSKQWLEDFLNRPVKTFSYPYGGRDTHYNAQSVASVRKAGFVRACTTCCRAVGRSDAPQELPRINVTDMNGEEFEKLLLSQ